jgi:hypothetical protein
MSQEATTVMTRYRFSFLVFLAATLTAIGGTAEAAGKTDPLTLKTPAFIGATGGDVMVKMRVEPDPRSRELTLEWVGEDLSGGSHAITLNGALAAATHQFALKRLSPGTHVVTAILRRSDGTEVRREATVTVVGEGGTESPISGAGSSGGLGANRR